MSSEEHPVQEKAGQKRALWILLLALLCVIVLLGLLWKRPVKSAPGEAAADFSLSDLDHHELKLHDYRGKVVLLNFWATWCAPCRAEIPYFVNLQNQYAGSGLQIIGISLDDDAKAVPPFYREFKMNYPVAVGDSQLAERYGGILGLPVSFVIGCDGRIYDRHTGEADIGVLEKEIKPLLSAAACVRSSATKQ